VFACVLSEGKPREMRVTVEGRQWLMNVVPWRHEQETRGLIYRVTDHTQHTDLQKQLYQMQKMETIGALAAGIAHDFNNLLQAIRGNISLLLLDPAVAPGISARLGQVDEAAGRAEKITQQLLAFSRASDETAAVVDFNELITEAGHLAKRTLRGQVVLKLEPASQPVKAQIDPTRAQQALLNLCVNAQDAMPDGGTLTLTNAIVPLNPSQAARAHTAVGSRFVRCSVADTGTGIPPQILSRIFDPFFTTKEKGKGTGLGLAIVHSVTNNAGGFVEVESTPGKGTTFHLYFPFAHAAVTNETKHSQKPISTGSGTVLVVDDLDLVVDFARAFLERAGYRVLSANSADAALKTLDREGTAVDLLLTDYSMPGKSGLELLREAVPRWPHLKLVLASGFLDEKERQQIEQTFGARILHKPYSISDATNLIREMLLARA
jgi:two-component system cell cycle sensor histidine kinase/response regulator CckA